MRGNGAIFGLYPSNIVLCVTNDQLLLQINDVTAWLDLQLMQSDDLMTWTNAGEAVYWSITVDSNKQFFRVRAEP